MKVSKERAEELILMNIDILKHSEKTLQRSDADLALKALLESQIARLRRETEELRKSFTAAELEEKGLLG